MAEEKNSKLDQTKQDQAKSDQAGSDQKKNRDEVALELMKFVAVTTGYGKGVGGAGFTGKTARTPEEHAESLLQLFERCRSIVAKEPTA